MTELSKSVEDWLSKSGYPLEMLVARALQGAGFGVVQSEYFEDPELGKWREADVIAYEHHYGKTCRVISSFVVECKSTKGKPWVLFTSPGLYPEGLSISRRASNEAGQSVLNTLSSNTDLQRLPLFSLPERPGYGITVALKDANQDTAYEALQSVGRATLGIINRLSKVQEENLLPFAWPIIVISSPLFESYLEADGTFRVEQIDKGLLIWRNPLVNRHTIVHIYTQDKFLAEASDLRQSALIFVQAAASEHDRWPRLKPANNALEADAGNFSASGRR